mgnify:FL=1
MLGPDFTNTPDDRLSQVISVSTQLQVLRDVRQAMVCFDDNQLFGDYGQCVDEEFAKHLTDVVTNLLIDAAQVSRLYPVVQMFPINVSALATYATNNKKPTNAQIRREIKRSNMIATDSRAALTVAVIVREVRIMRYGQPIFIDAHPYNTPHMIRLAVADNVRVSPHTVTRSMDTLCVALGYLDTFDYCTKFDAALSVAEQIEMIDDATDHVLSRMTSAIDSYRAYQTVELRQQVRNATKAQP